jgi:hypothetical protein|tara:strand:+ start:78320 stop:78469 length:150 start_codon:yes stop_codon:yes gene_type:complete
MEDNTKRHLQEMLDYMNLEQDNIIKAGGKPSKEFYNHKKSIQEKINEYS